MLGVCGACLKFESNQTEFCVPVCSRLLLPTPLAHNGGKKYLVPGSHYTTQEAIVDVTTNVASVCSKKIQPKADTKTKMMKNAPEFSKTNTDSSIVSNGSTNETAKESVSSADPDPDIGKQDPLKDTSLPVTSVPIDAPASASVPPHAKLPAAPTTAQRTEEISKPLSGKNIISNLNISEETATDALDGKGKVQPVVERKDADVHSPIIKENDEKNTTKSPDRLGLRAKQSSVVSTNATVTANARPIQKETCVEVLDEKQQLLPPSIDKNVTAEEVNTIRKLSLIVNQEAIETTVAGQADKNQIIPSSKPIETITKLAHCDQSSQALSERIEPNCMSKAAPSDEEQTVSKGGGVIEANSKLGEQVSIPSEQDLARKMVDPQTNSTVEINSNPSDRKGSLVTKQDATSKHSDGTDAKETPSTASNQEDADVKHSRADNSDNDDNAIAFSKLRVDAKNTAEKIRTKIGGGVSLKAAPENDSRTITTLPASTPTMKQTTYRDAAATTLNGRTNKVIIAKNTDGLKVATISTVDPASQSNLPEGKTDGGNVKDNTRSEADNTKVVAIQHPYIGKMVRISQGRFYGLQGRVLSRKSGGWWVIDHPDLILHKVLSHQCQLVDKVEEDDLHQYYAKLGGGKQKLDPISICTKPASFPVLKAATVLAPAAGPPPQAKTPLNEEEKVSGSNLTKESNDDAPEKQEPNATKRKAQDAIIDDTIGTTTENGVQDCVKEGVVRQKTISQTRKKFSPEDQTELCILNPMSSDGDDPEYVPGSPDSPDSEQSNSIESSATPRGDLSKRTSTLSDDTPQRKRARPEIKSHQPEFDILDDDESEVFDPMETNNKADVNDRAVNGTTNTNTIFASAPELQPMQLVYQQRQPHHIPTEPPVILKSPYTSVVLPSALRHLPLDFKVDIFDRRSGKVLSGSDAACVKDLPELLNKHASYEPIIPPSVEPTSAHSRLAEKKYREGRSSSNVRVSAVVNPQIRFQVSSFEGRSVVVTKGPYRGLVGKIYACIPGGWYLIDDILKEDALELPVVISPKHVELLPDLDGKEEKDEDQQVSLATQQIKKEIFMKEFHEFLGRHFSGPIRSYKLRVDALSEEKKALSARLLQVQESTGPKGDYWVDGGARVRIQMRLDHVAKEQEKAERDLDEQVNTLASTKDNVVRAFGNYEGGALS